MPATPLRLTPSKLSASFYSASLPFLRLRGYNQKTKAAIPRRTAVRYRRQHHHDHPLSHSPSLSSRVSKTSDEHPLRGQLSVCTKPLPPPTTRPRRCTRTSAMLGRSQDGHCTVHCTAAVSTRPEALLELSWDAA